MIATHYSDVNCRPLLMNSVVRHMGMGSGGTAAAAPPPFRPGNPALCGSCPL